MGQIGKHFFGGNEKECGINQILVRKRLVMQEALSGGRVGFEPTVR